MNAALSVLDLFSAAAGGWSLGMHRAGFHTVAACEWTDWRRALYLQNNPGVRMYDDVRTLTGEQLLRDLGFLPGIVVGSPPCQDVSPANTKGKGVKGERSGLYFEAVRIIGEVRPRWFALENSANLRTRGADLVLAALEELGYACWSFVVRAGDIGANHERPRSWLIGCDVEQVADAGCWEQWEQPRRWHGANRSSEAFDGLYDPEFAADPNGYRQHSRAGLQGSGQWNEPSDHAGNAAEDRCGAGRPGRRFKPASGLSFETCGHAAGAPSDADQAGQTDGRLVSSLRPAQEPHDGCGDVGGDDVAHADREGQPDLAVDAEMGRSPGTGEPPSEPWADWNSGLAHHLRVDDGLSAWVAQSRIAVGGPRGTSAASLIVEAFGDAVVPQIPEAIGRAILRTERAVAAVYARPVDERAVA